MPSRGRSGSNSAMMARSSFTCSDGRDMTAGEGLAPTEPMAKPWPASGVPKIMPDPLGVPTGGPPSVGPPASRSCTVDTTPSSSSSTAVERKEIHGRRTERSVSGQRQKRTVVRGTVLYRMTGSACRQSPTRGAPA